MKYIVYKTTEIIKRNAPAVDGEAMIRVDGFEDVRFYESLALKINQCFSESELSVDIKLAKNKWKFFSKDTSMTSYLQSMEQHNWIAGEESITRYRNLHAANLLVLMGTESEEDKGGLLNCFCITADSIAADIDGQYSEVFMYLSDFTDAERAIIDKLYGDLFSYVPVDIFKLSKIADAWEGQISNIGDFTELFFANLDEWGLPIRRNNLPSSKELRGKKNVLELQHKFISRALFKKMTMKQYADYQAKLDKYAEDGGEYGFDWDGWTAQAINSYNQFKTVVMEYTRGENADYNRTLLERTDFDIVAKVLDIKLDKPIVERKTNIKLKGAPLTVFTKALMYTLLDCIGEDISQITFSINQADVVSLYSDSEGSEEKEQLIETWKTICRHTNGVVSIINQRSWSIDGEDIEVGLLPEDIFSPNSALVNVDKGIVKAASANKTISKIEFTAKCYREDGTFVSKLSPKFTWEFPDTSAWTHDFSDICVQEVCVNKNMSFIPVVYVNKMNALIFAKSEEEFFDLYEESDILFDFNLVDFIQKKAGSNAQAYVGQFLKLGYSFAEFISTVKEDGFFVSIAKGAESETVKLIKEYVSTGELLTKQTLPENLRWMLDAYIHAFNIETDTTVLTSEIDAKCCVVPPWHPATLQKMLDQKNFFLDGCLEWWNENGAQGIGSKTGVNFIINNLEHMGLIQSALDLFPSSGQQYFGSTASFGAFSVYARNDIENNSRLKDIIHKDAIFDDDFDAKEIAQMNDNAKMIYGVIHDYSRAFQNDNNLSLVFVNPIELQPIVAAIYKYIEYVRKRDANGKINISLKILVKPENKGGRNYLSYWMDEFFSQDANVNIRTYLNEWTSVSDLEKFLNGNNDIVFMMDLLTVNNLLFIKDTGKAELSTDECRFPIVYKPTPISETTVKRKIELSQPQFGASYEHTQVVRFRNNMETVPDGKYIAVREVCIDQKVQEMVYALHSKAYWVVCVDSGMDGALLRNDEEHKDEYSIIGFSTGKGAYGQYNLTITARKSILTSIRNRLSSRLYQLFSWEHDKVDKAASICINEAGKLDGISLFSAVNPKDHNVNEFMAYVLTSLREKKSTNDSALKIMIHLDSYKHWFNSDLEKDEDESASRPDFLLLEARDSGDGKLHLDAIIIECKIAGVANSEEHKEKAYNQVKHGIKRLSTVFDPGSKSIKRRYWYAQLYRALAFAQVTFSDNSSEFASIAAKLRTVLDGNFDISWSGKVLGYWIDMQGDEEIMHSTETENIFMYDIPQTVVQKLLLGDNIDVNYVSVSDEVLTTEEEQARIIELREKELNKEIKSMQRNNKPVLQTEPVQQEEKPNERLQEVVPADGQRIDVVPEIVEDTTETIVKNELSQEDVPIHTEGVNAVETTPKDNTDALKTISGAERVLIGSDKLSNKIFWEFGNSQLANRHMLITGTSGQGKTYSIQTMLYELSKFDVSAIVFDYTEGFRFDQLEKNFLDRMGDKVKQHVIYYTGVPINPFKRQEIEVAGMSMPEKSADVAARIANIFKHVYDFGDQQFSAIFEAARKGMEKYGDQMSMQLFQEMLEEEKSNNKTAQSVLSKMAPFFYSIEFNTSDEFDWGKILYADEAELNIFQLTSIDREMQVIITELMLWDAWYYTKKVGSKDKPFVAILDEAQNLSHKSNSPSAAILTEGRKFGWSAWFATQSLKVLADDEVVRLLQAANKLYFKPTDDEIVKMAKQLDPTDGNLWLSALKNLKKGQCIVVGDRVGSNGKFGATKPTITTVISFEERE